jgi:MSHA biogenesis protein MshP
MKSPVYSLARMQRGLSLATALFVITVMAVLAAMIFQLVRNNAQTTQEEILLVRSFYAAETGIQFGLNRIFPPDGLGGDTCPFTPSPTTTMTYNLKEDGVNECKAEVTCTNVTADGTNYVTVRSKGTCGDVSRTLQVRAR